MRKNIISYVEKCRPRKKEYLTFSLVFLLCFALSAQVTLWILSETVKDDDLSIGGNAREVKAGFETLESSRSKANDSYEQVKQELSEQSRPIVVIDAGHGGMDGGAVAADGTQEKDINLAIAKALEDIVSEYPLEVVMTREDDSGLYTDDDRTVREKKREDLQNRKKLMENDGVLIGVSIHLNSFPQDEKIFGAQVFYPQQKSEETSVRNAEGTEENLHALSKDFAEAVQRSLEINIDDGRERTAMMKNDILLFKNAETNMILAECGFLSNPNEAERLKNAEYQQLLAQAIWEGINEILCMEKTEKLKIIVSANSSK